MTSYTIYVVDDNPTIRKLLLAGLGKHYAVEVFDSAENALEGIESNPPDLVLLDVALPDLSGIEVLRRLKKLHPDILVIMVTASDDTETAVSAMKLGAYDYSLKPINMEALKACIRNALEKIRLRKEVQDLQEKYLKENTPCFVGESNAIQDVMDIVGKTAKSPDTPVLIIGETGTGKELIAHAIHYKSPNFDRPFVSLNCSAIPKDLLESELFGYEKGAFTGADASGKRGLVEQAAGGTLFLDEVGDLSLEAQAKLLRFLEEGEFYRVGGTEKRTIHTRIVSATNKDLEGMIEKDYFRQDLYYRLAVIKIEVPSLNHRREDVVPIARHFLAEFSGKHGKSFTRFSPQTEGLLKNTYWKGNIRELRNVVERGVLMAEGHEMTLQDLGLERRMDMVSHPKMENRDGLPSLPDSGMDLHALEAHYIKEAVKKARGNDTKAAKMLGMSYYSFRYRKKKIKDLSLSSDNV
jgi:DNA-binding NtrC family response regulator